MRPYTWRLVRAVERQGWLDKPGYKLEHGLALALNLLGDASRPVRDVLHGVWWGQPVHPAMTDLPVGSWSATVVLDAAGALRQRGPGFAEATRVTLATGIVGALGAAATGLCDWQHTHDTARRVGLVHGAGNALALALQTGSWWARRRGDHGRGRALSAAAFGLTLFTAHLGGDLVYRHRIGTDHSGDRLEPRTFTPACPLAGLTDGKPQRVTVEGTPVVLIRRGEQVHALGAHCPHLGGPLDEGWLHNGALTCPWHASQFDPATGEVLRGPATAPATCYEVRQAGGWVYVRRVPPDRSAPPGSALAYQQHYEDRR